EWNCRTLNNNERFGRSHKARKNNGYPVSIAVVQIALLFYRKGLRCPECLIKVVHGFKKILQPFIQIRIAINQGIHLIVVSSLLFSDEAQRSLEVVKVFIKEQHVYRAVVVVFEDGPELRKSRILHPFVLCEEIL